MKTELVQRDPVVELEFSIDEFRELLVALLEAEAQGPKRALAAREWAMNPLCILIGKLKDFAEDNAHELQWF